MGIRNDVFGLEQLYVLQVKGDWSTKSDAFQTEASIYRQAHPYGYWVGGTQGSASNDSSKFDRVDFTNDEATALTRANLAVPIRASATIANADYGYSAGGVHNANHSTVERLALANDTVTPLIRGPLSSEKLAMQVSGNKNYAWISGGNEGSGPILSLDRIDYSNDTATASARTNLPVEMGGGNATGTQDYGYHGNGSAPGVSYLTTLYRIDYANDTTITTKGPLLTARWGSAATGNASYGWWGAGYNGSNTSNTDRIDYASDTATATPKGNVHSTRVLGASGNQNFGYWGAGGAPAVATVTRLQYANDTSNAATKGSLTRTGYNINAFGALENNFSVGTMSTTTAFRVDWQYGYITQGYVPTPIASSISRIDFSNDGVLQSFRSNTTTARYDPQGTGSKTHGYIQGGATPGVVSSTERFSYANDTATTVTAGNGTITRETGSAVSTADYGYFGGGTGALSSVDRITFSNDTTALVTKGPLSSPRYYPSANSNADYGYFAGGGPGPYSTIDRIDFANDTVSAPQVCSLANPESNMGGAGNRHYGWFGGGTSNPTLVYRLDYSNDSINASTRGNLDIVRHNVNSTGNQSFGYFCGGQPVPVQSVVQRVDYANDTATSSPRGFMTYSASNMAGMSAVENGLPSTPISIPTSSPINYGTNKVSYPYGYLMGGSPALTFVHRIDYANDNVNPVLRGNLDQGQTYGTATANNDYAYAAGGLPSYSSTVNRIDFSNDTAKALRTGDMTLALIYAAGVSNRSHAYYCGGIHPSSGTYSTVQRQDYASDMTTISPKGPLSAGKKEGGAAGTQNYGWVFAADQPGINTRVDRIDYSNDTVTAANRSNCQGRRYGAYGATGNENFGYFSGGETPALTSTTERLDYANDTTGTVFRGNLTEVRKGIGATGNSSYGWFAGGAVPGAISTVSRIDYSNDTNAMSARGPLPSPISFKSAASSQDDSNAKPLLANVPTTTIATNFGYFGQGNVKKLDRIDYTNDTATALNRIPNFNYSPSGYRNPTAVSSNYAGYWAPSGGSSGSVNLTVKKVDYSNDTTSTNIAPLVNARGYRGGTGNKDFGYFAGGSPNTSSGKSTNVDRIDYSNDTMPGLERGPLLTAMGQCTAIGNQNFGYFRNTYDGPTNRIDYSNDTQTASPKASTGGYFDDAATGNGDFAYIVAASALTTTNINRFDYSNDTVAGSQRSYLSVIRFRCGATGNKNFGYFSGGGSPPPTYLSSIDRLDFSNDTATASPKGLLSGYQYDHAQSPTSAAESNNPQ